MDRKVRMDRAKERAEERAKDGAEGKEQVVGGRGKKIETESSDMETAPHPGSSTDKPKGKSNRGFKKKEDQQDWAAWGTEDAWSQGWTDDWDAKGWAWDSVSWWDSQCSAYELEGNNPDHPEKHSKKKESKRKAEMMAEEHPEDADTSDKKAKVQKKTKTEKEAEEHHDKDEDMTEKPAAEKKKNTSAKANAKRKPAKKKTKKETHDTDDSRKKKTKQTSRPAANQVTCAKRIQDLPAEDHKKVQKMLDFMAGVADLTEEQAKLLV